MLNDKYKTSIIFILEFKYVMILLVKCLWVNTLRGCYTSIALTLMNDYDPNYLIFVELRRARNSKGTQLFFQR